jgi:hypothetical protein
MDDLLGIIRAVNKNAQKYYGTNFSKLLAGGDERWTLEAF